MAAAFEPLDRILSASSARSDKSGHHLSAAASDVSLSRKGRFLDPDTTTTDIDRTSISMPPPATGKLRQQSFSRRASRVVDPSTIISLDRTSEEDAMSTSLDGAELSKSDDTPTLLAKSDGSITPAVSSLLSPAVEGISRKSEPDLDSNRTSFSSLYNYGAGFYNAAKNAYTSAPSSVAGGSDIDGVRKLGPEVATGQADEGVAKHEPNERATTATQTLSVTTQSQNGALSPSLNGTLRDQYLPTTKEAAVGSPATSPSSPAPRPSQQGRTLRGRTPANSRRVSGSLTASPSASVDRSSTSTVLNPNRIGTLGICALDAKARSKPSRNILNRIVGKNNEDFDVIIFGDKIILDENVENWPVCDFLISFFSDGFPLEKAIAYAKLRKPFCVNDLPMQTILWDRRICLYILDNLTVPTPARVEVNRDGGPVLLSTDIADRLKQLSGVTLQGSEDGRGGGEEAPADVHMENDNDTLVVDGKKLSKPFVEKPVSGEDHNIYIYYPKSQGGGGRRLFRKVNNKSSEKDENLTFPRSLTEKSSSYIYEQFLKTENAEDVKAYTVGPDYCHAETRKSPVVDGVVKRNPNGKELRYVTSLSKEEQTMAAKIATGFGQQVCGFDLLRVEDQSFVIDVNGWSFVKDNNEYYDRCASILKAMFIREKMKWEGRATPSELSDGDSEGKMLPPSSTPEQGIKRKSTFGKALKEGEGHRNALKSVLRSRSISQLRDSVSKAAHHHGQPGAAKSTSGATSPITSPPGFERNAPIPKRAPTIPVIKDDVLPPPAAPQQLEKLRHESGAVSADQLDRTAAEVPASVPAPASKSQWKLKGMVAVIRHADRTPKQKFKFTFHTKPFVDLLKGHQEEVLLVGEAALAQVQQAVRQAMQEGEEDMTKLRTLSNALAKKGAWPGTKVQIKPMFKKPKDKDKKKDKGDEKAQKAKAERAPPTQEEIDAAAWKAKMEGEAEQKFPKDFPEDDATGPAGARAQHRADSISEVTMSRATAQENRLVLDKLQLVMKWGGEPTHSARYQAADLGENMRNDLLLMNRDVLNDVSIFTSSERRVTTSAQIFAGAFLDQKEVGEEQIHIRKDLLDDSNAAKDEMDRVKKKLKGLLRQGHLAPENFAWPKDGTPEPYLVVRNVVELMKFHRRVMRHNFTKLGLSDAVSSLEKIKNPPQPGSTGTTASNGDADTDSSGVSQASSVQARWCTGEDASLFKERWEKLFNEFVDAEKVDPSKISELYDTMKFDALHNRQFLEWVFTPSKSLLQDEERRQSGASGDERLRRTESMDARAEFEHTHAGQEPVKEDEPPKVDGEPKPHAEKSPPGSIKGDRSEKDRQTIAERIGFGRRSSVANRAISGAGVQQSREQSYFNLFTGNVGDCESKTKHDVRLEKLNELYSLSKILFDYIGPQEYGITDEEKLEIGLLTSLPLLKEIVKDLEEVQASDDAKSFIYFTKESHIYTLLNCILEGGVQTKISRNAIPELDYLSQICFELYESENAEADIDPENPESNYNYSIRITISPGCHTFDPLDVQLDSKHCIGCAPRRSLTPHGQWKEVLGTLRAKFHTVKLPKSFLAVNLSEKVPQEFGQEEGVASVDDVEYASPIAPQH